jgi:CRP-like cAMP-binding protein
MEKITAAGSRSVTAGPLVEFWVARCRVLLAIGEAVMTIRRRLSTSKGLHPFIEKLTAYVDFDDEEVAALTALFGSTRIVLRGREIVAQGKPYRALYALNEGLALKYRVLADGRRQVLNLIVPGDLVGLPICMFESAIASVSALTESSISSIEFGELFKLFQRYPRIGIALFWVSAREAGILIERLTTIGKRPAYERLAHLILELLSRFQVVGLAGLTSFALPLTQGVLADALGLSLQHVSRMVRNLRLVGLASIMDREVTIHDMDALIRLSGFEGGYLSQSMIPVLSPRGDDQCSWGYAGDPRSMTRPIVVS